MAYWAWWIVVVTAIGVPISIGGLYLLVRSLGQTRQAISIDREVGHAQVRAYLSFQLPATRLPVGRAPEARFKINNTGQSPAYNVRYVADFQVLQHPLADSQRTLVQPAPGQKLPSGSIAAGGEIIGDVTADFDMTRELIDATSDGAEKRIYLAAEVYYNDVFKQPHRTQLCAFLVISRGRVTADSAHRVIIGSDWELSRVCNEAD